ncbi:hypothetical protein BIW11_10728 [Tropilaelaps mercedesae]|uniref:Uncharacterized protein n=1 Tax=Tropilaelaps mercedesae TaxID=418985 RepID=A0A1V9XEL4_9ACAR|nr:hypothetical protein BIW11_10728 [Tropilaelaps mercedesae]
MWGESPTGGEALTAPSRNDEAGADMPPPGSPQVGNWVSGLESSTPSRNGLANSDRFAPAAAAAARTGPKPIRRFRRVRRCTAVGPPTCGTWAETRCPEFGALGLFMFDPSNERCGPMNGASSGRPLAGYSGAATTTRRSELGAAFTVPAAIGRIARAGDEQRGETERKRARKKKPICLEAQSTLACPADVGPRTAAGLRGPLGVDSVPGENPPTSVGTDGRRRAEQKLPSDFAIACAHVRTGEQSPQID